MQSQASILIIGNEVLSGRTDDRNIQMVASMLGEIGLRVGEVRIVPDVTQRIVSALNELRHTYKYVFTTGGIGPTHDDITAASVAQAFGLDLVQHPDALAALQGHYEDGELNEARLKMAQTPKGATLIDNPISAAPGFVIENVYVMAGVPKICEVMMQSLLPQLDGGAPIFSQTVSCLLTEGEIAAELSCLQDAFDPVEIGSYPYFKHGEFGVSLVARGTDKTQVEQTAVAIQQMVDSFQKK